MEENKGQNKIIETYSEDMAEAIRDDEGGLVKKMIEEEERKQLEKIMDSPESLKNKFYLVSSSVLVIVALFSFLFFALKSNNSIVEIPTQFEPLIFNDKSFFLETRDLSKEQIIESILAQARATNLKPGGIEGIYFTRDYQIIGLREFLSLFKSSLKLPDQNLVSDNFLLGVSNQMSKNIFILIKMRSFTDIFENIKAWEAKMFYDLHSLFGVPINAETNYLVTKNFEDAIIENKNASILRDKEGNIVMMYVFADENSVVIANKVEAVQEIITRLSGSQIKK